MGMPDIHWGYGFPIGGVAATLADDGVVSPGGVGFDINCGVRLLRAPISSDEIFPRLKRLLEQIYRDVPVGAGGGQAKGLSKADEEAILALGAEHAVAMGFGVQEDLEFIESQGGLLSADPRLVGERARLRGRGQLGTLGSGNHFLEIQAVDAVLDQRAAETFGLSEPGQVTVMIHTGSRGLGHQVCQDFLGRMQGAMTRYGIEVPDRQLACVPVRC